MPAAPRPTTPRYYLEIAPADGVDVSQAYDVQIGTTTAIPDKVTNQVYLPVVLR